MLKKNNSHSYTFDTQVERILRVKELIYAAAVIISGVISLYLAYKLAPYNENLKLLNQRVSASESRIENLEQNVGSIKDDTSQIKEDVGYIRGLLEPRR